jgi:HK97 family phage prohead protease
MIERRFISVTELRAAKDGKTISGLAATYNKLSSPIPAGRDSSRSFREKLAPGAFRSAVASGQDVTLLVNHDPDKLLGRTASGTLQLNDTKRGLEFRCSMPNTQLGNDTREMIERGDLNGCSFGFALGKRDDDWSEEEDDEEDLFGKDDNNQKVQKRGKTLVRTIRNVSKLYDVSVVTRPAYNGTSVDCRSLVEVCTEVPADVLTRYTDQPRDENGGFSNGADAKTAQQHSESASHHVDSAAEAQVAGDDFEAELHRVAATAHDIAAKFPSDANTEFAQKCSKQANAFAGRSDSQIITMRRRSLISQSLS